MSCPLEFRMNLQTRWMQELSCDGTSEERSLVAFATPGTLCHPIRPVWTVWTAKSKRQSRIFRGKHTPPNRSHRFGKLEQSPGTIGRNPKLKIWPEARSRWSVAPSSPSDGDWPSISARERRIEHMKWDLFWASGSWATTTRRLGSYLDRTLQRPMETFSICSEREWERQKRQLNYRWGMKSAEINEVN